MGKGNKAEMLIAVCAVISSIAAVYIAWDQARVMRSQEKADVWPILQLTHDTSIRDAGVQYEFHVDNAGVGPALVNAYTIRIPGQEDTESFDEMVDYFISGALDKTYGAPVRSNLSLKGRVIRQGDRARPVGAFWPAADGLEEAFLTRVNLFASGGLAPAEIFVCYCSILDDCWVSSSNGDGLRPVEVKTCAELPGVVDKFFPKSSIPPQTEESIQ